MFTFKNLKTSKQADEALFKSESKVLDQKIDMK